jgi:hypothetical protein
MRPQQVDNKEPLTVTQEYEKATEEYFRKVMKRLKQKELSEKEKKFWAELIEKAK